MFAGVVHLCGGTAALVVSILLGPRKGRYDNGPAPPPVGNGTNIILGTFFLWYGGFTFAVHTFLFHIYKYPVFKKKMTYTNFIVTVFSK